MSINAPTIKQVYWVEDKATGTLKRIQKEQGKTAGSMGVTDKKSKVLTKSLGGLAAGLTAVAVAGASLKFLKDSVVTFAKFEAQMNKTRAVSGASADEMQRLTEQAKALGANTALSASNVGELQFELSKLGFTVDQITESTGDVGNLSLALGHDLADSAAIAGKTLRQFGLEADEMGRVVDNIAQGASSSALDITSFSEAMKFAGGTAGQLGFDIEETTAAIGQLANVGISGTLAGTGLNRVLLDLTDSSSKAGKALKGFEGESDDLTGMLQHLNKQGLSANEIFNIFGKVAGKSALALIRNADAVGELEEKQRAANDRVKEMSGIMAQGLAGELKTLASAWESLQLAIGKSLGGDAGKTAVKVTTQLVRNLKWQYELLTGKKADDAIQKSHELSEAFRNNGDVMSEALQHLTALNKAEEDGTKSSFNRNVEVRKSKKALRELIGTYEDIVKVDGKWTISKMTEKEIMNELIDIRNSDERARIGQIEIVKKQSKAESDAMALAKKDIDNAIAVTRAYREVQISAVDKIKEKFENQIATLRALRGEADAEDVARINQAISRAENQMAMEVESYRQAKAKQAEIDKARESQILAFQQSKIESIKAEEITEQQLVDFKKSKYAEQIEIDRTYQETRAMWREQDLNDFKAYENAKKDAAFSVANEIVNTTASILSIGFNKERDELSSRMSAEIDAVNNRDQKLTAAEKRKAKEITAIKRKFAQEEFKIQEAEWGVQGGQIAASGALAVTKALATGGPLAIPLSIATGAAVAGQVAVWAANKPEPPKLATGAFVQGSQQGAQVIVGENGNDEEIFGMGSKGVPRRSKFASEVAEMVGSRGSSNISVTVNEAATPQLTAIAVVEALEEAQLTGMVRA